MLPLDSNDSIRHDSSASRPGPPATARAAYAVVVGPLSALLLVAAGLKADVAINGGPGAARGTPWVPPMLAAVAESAVAAWLLSGLWPAWARRAAMALLLVFVAVAGWHLLRGDTDCGCFGRVRVHPAVTLGVDIVALVSVALLGQWLSKPDGRSRRVLPVRVILAVLAGVLVPTSIVVVGAPPEGDAEDAVIDATLLSPRDWVGKPLPILDALEPSDRDLSRGRWVLILLNRGCHSCEDYLAHTDFGAITWPDGHKAAPDELVMIEAGKPSAKVQRSVAIPFPSLPLRPGQTYLVDGPYEVFLVDGRVEAVRRRVGMSTQ